MSERRPFHEVIVDTIRSFTSPVTDRVFITFLAGLIKQTKIPKNHDAIIKEWKDFMDRTSRMDFWGVIDDLVLQKQEAEDEARRRHEAEIREIFADAREDCN